VEVRSRASEKFSHSVGNWQAKATLISIRAFYKRSHVFQRVRNELKVGELQVMTRLKGLTSSSSAAPSERSQREAVRHRREARTGEHQEYANQSADGYLWKYFNHESGRKQGRLGVGCSVWLGVLARQHELRQQRTRNRAPE
jgi:hypothetical protein